MGLVLLLLQFTLGWDCSLVHRTTGFGEKWESEVGFLDLANLRLLAETVVKVIGTGLLFFSLS